MITADLNGTPRMLANCDAINNLLADANVVCSGCANDGNGHGTHVTSLIASSNTTDPVLNGLNRILANKTTYGNGGIRVVNLSFGAAPQSYYWNDPIDQAVMKLWQAGIVVVASAGNSRPTERHLGRWHRLVLLDRPHGRGLRQTRPRCPGRPRTRRSRPARQRCSSCRGPRSQQRL